MTAGELIALLSQHPPATPVVLYDYWGGYAFRDVIAALATLGFRDKANERWAQYKLQQLEHKNTTPLVVLH
jgi:hypothetical protein